MDIKLSQKEIKTFKAMNPQIKDIQFENTRETHQRK